MQRIDHGIVGGLVVEEGDVVAERAGEQFDLLGDERDAASEFVERDLTDRDPAERHEAAGGFDESEHEPRERGLAAAGASDDPDRPARLDSYVDVAQHRPIVAVVERDIDRLDGQRARRRMAGAGVDDHRRIARSSATRTIAPLAFCTVSSS